MKGKHRVIVQNNRLHYELEIKRNITIIQGDSATGKTTLINMIRQYENKAKPYNRAIKSKGVSDKNGFMINYYDKI